MKRFKPYVLSLTEIGLTLVLLLLLTLTRFGLNSFGDNMALLFTIIFTLIYASISICYMLAYTNTIKVNWRANDRARDIFNISWQSAAHLVLGVTVLDYVYFYLKNDLYCFIVLLLAVVAAVSDFFIRYRKLF